MKYSILVLLYMLKLFVCCKAQCLLESEATVGVEDGEIFSNKEEIVKLGAESWRLNEIRNCQDD